ncbi:hypothetical protein QBC44DRAFT_386248 [Cladorrhinum sp. PSN332]|nr:hypothetical protein QBC44DRAFT_386248 [Cladorrhinum sp. PSN332]
MAGQTKTITYELEAFTWNNIALSDPDYSWEDCATPLEYTTLVVKMLIDPRKTTAGIHRILSGGKTLKRLYTPHRYRVAGQMRTAGPPDMQRGLAHRGVAIALYLFGEGKAPSNRCQQCSSHHHTGPANECWVPSDMLTERACTNCYYSGTGHNCSHRKEHEAKMLKREGEKDAAVAKPVTLEYLDIQDDDTLKQWRGDIEDEIKHRLDRPGSPKKKTKRN